MSKSTKITFDLSPSCRPRKKYEVVRKLRSGRSIARMRCLVFVPDEHLFNARGWCSKSCSLIKWRLCPRPAAGCKKKKKRGRRYWLCSSSDPHETPVQDVKEYERCREEYAATFVDPLRYLLGGHCREAGVVWGRPRHGHGYHQVRAVRARLRTHVRVVADGVYGVDSQGVAVVLKQEVEPEMRQYTS